MKTLTIIGRRWFQRGPGNTYHSAEILIDGKPVHKIPYAYGYGEGYLQSAFEWLESNGHVKLERYANGSTEPPWQYCQKHDIEFHHQAIDVPRKKDL